MVSRAQKVKSKSFSCSLHPTTFIPVIMHFLLFYVILLKNFLLTLDVESRHPQVNVRTELVDPFYTPSSLPANQSTS